jgi:hypothetical protein
MSTDEEAVLAKDDAYILLSFLHNLSSESLHGFAYAGKYDDPEQLVRYAKKIFESARNHDHTRAPPKRGLVNISVAWFCGQLLMIKYVIGSTNIPFDISCFTIVGL